MKNNKKKISIPFWIQIFAILLVGVIASVIVLLFAPNRHQPATETTPGANVIKHTVTFAYLDGTIIETKTVEEGKGVFPPVLETTGVFRGWSAGFNAVKADIEVHPIFYNIKEENLFYFDSVYVKEDTEFTLDLYVAGVVNISSGTITLSYDTDVLEYKKSDGMDGLIISENKAGELTIQFSTDTPLNEKTLISQLSFYAKKRDAYSTQVNLSASDTMILSNGKEISANCATINNKIYFLQEVGE